MAQAYNQTGNTAPDADANLLKAFFSVIQKLAADGKLLAYHDRSDGGLFATLCEMAFAARCGLDISLTPDIDPLAELFSEELGAVIQINTSDTEAILKSLNAAMPNSSRLIGKPARDEKIIIKHAGKAVYQNTRAQLQAWWAETSYRIQALRDNPDCAKQEFENISSKDPGISPVIAPTSNFQLPSSKLRPKVAIFRVQGVNGQVEMAASFDPA